MTLNCTEWLACQRHTVIQKDLNRLEKWADRNKEQCRVLHVGQNNQYIHQYMLVPPSCKAALQNTP